MSSASVIAGFSLSASPRTRSFDLRLARRSIFSSNWMTHLAMLLLLVMASTILAHAQATDGAITGSVIDSQGGVLPGAAITATNQETGLIRTAVAGDDGHYRLAPLPPGPYAIKAEQQGFTTTELNGLVLTIGLELPQDLVLKVGSTTQVVTVNEALPIVQTTRPRLRWHCPHQSAMVQSSFPSGLPKDSGNTAR